MQLFLQESIILLLFFNSFYFCMYKRIGFEQKENDRPYRAKYLEIQGINHLIFCTVI